MAAKMTKVAAGGSRRKKPEARQQYEKGQDKTPAPTLEPRATADLVDCYLTSGRIQACETQFLQLGRRASFSGPIRTIKTWEDNDLIKRMLSEPGRGQVLVVDGGGSLRVALVGDRLATLAASNGWAGLVIFGAVRDVAALKQVEIGIKALGSNPWKSNKDGFGSVDVPLQFGNVSLVPGDWIYSDEDGLLVAKDELE
jgi:regulator of ribonuclease activity A